MIKFFLFSNFVDEIQNDDWILGWMYFVPLFWPDCISPKTSNKISSWSGDVLRIMVMVRFVEWMATNSEKYIYILDYNLWLAEARHFPDNNFLFIIDNAPVHQFHLSTTYKNTIQYPSAGEARTVTRFKPHIECMFCWLLKKTSKSLMNYMIKI